MQAKPIPLKRRNFSGFNEQLYIDDISMQNWNDDSLHDTNGKFDDFVGRLEKYVDRHDPLPKVNRKQMNK